MTTLIWNIEALRLTKLQAPAGEHKDVVSSVKWTCTPDPQTSPDVQRSGLCKIPAPDSSTPFTEYPALTKEQVLGWVFANGVDKAQVESQVEALAARAAAIAEAEAHPNWNAKPLPWA